MKKPYTKLAKFNKDDLNDKTIELTTKIVKEELDMSIEDISSVEFGYEEYTIEEFQIFELILNIKYKEGEIKRYFRVTYLDEYEASYRCTAVVFPGGDTHIIDRGVMPEEISKIDDMRQAIKYIERFGNVSKTAEFKELTLEHDYLNEKYKTTNFFAQMSVQNIFKDFEEIE